MTEEKISDTVKTATKRLNVAFLFKMAIQLQDVLPSFCVKKLFGKIALPGIVSCSIGKYGGKSNLCIQRERMLSI